MNDQPKTDPLLPGVGPHEAKAAVGSAGGFARRHRVNHQLHPGRSHHEDIQPVPGPGRTPNVLPAAHGHQLNDGFQRE